MEHFRLLSITNLSATDLEDIRFMGKMKVYAIVSVTGGPPTGQHISEFTTSVDMEGETNPKWDSRIDFTLHDPSLQNNLLYLDFNFHFSRTSGDKHVGVVRVPVKPLFDMISAKRTASEAVRYPVEKSSGGEQGFVNFCFAFGAPIQPSPQQTPPPPYTPQKQYLDESKKLILAILENQNLGKLAECAQYQTQLQSTLMFLAAIADAQPQAPTMPAQMAPHPAMQSGGFYMQHPQAAAMAQQQGIFPQKVPLQFNNPHQMQEQQQQQHQHHQAAIQGQMGMRPGGTNNGMHPPHTEATLGGGSSGVPPSAAGPSDGCGGSKQDGFKAGAGGTDGQGGSGGGDGESSYMKGAEDAK